MKRAVFAATTFIVSALMPHSATAELRWDTMEQQVGYTSDKIVVTARFDFRNVGDKAVAISRVTMSCSCVQARVSKEYVEAGGSGEIVVTINRRGRGAVFKKTIAVKTSEKERTFLS